MDSQVGQLYTRTEALIRVLNILGGLNEDNVHRFKTLVNLVSDIKTGLDQLTAIIEAKKASIVKSERLCEELDYYQEYLEHVEKYSVELHEIPVNQLQELNIQTREVSPCPQSWSRTLATPAAKVPQSIAKNGSHMRDDVTPDCSLSHISVQEVNMLHKYMRGRLTADMINSLVNVINSALIKKYTILKQKKNDLKKSEKDLHLNWKILERNASISAGQFFFTAEDLLTLENYKLDKIAYSIIVILRHTKRLKEVRFESKLLYVLM